MALKKQRHAPARLLATSRHHGTTSMESTHAAHVTQRSAPAGRRPGTDASSPGALPKAPGSQLVNPEELETSPRAPGQTPRATSHRPGPVGNSPTASVPEPPGFAPKPLPDPTSLRASSHSPGAPAPPSSPHAAGTHSMALVMRPDGPTTDPCAPAIDPGDAALMPCPWEQLPPAPGAAALTALALSPSPDMDAAQLRSMGVPQDVIDMMPLRLIDAETHQVRLTKHNRPTCVHVAVSTVRLTFRRKYAFDCGSLCICATLAVHHVA